MFAMKNFILIFIICNFFSLSFSFNGIIANAGCAEIDEDIPEEFKELLKKGKLTFEAPPMKLIDAHKDPLMKYDIAYVDEANGFEIRINIVPLDSNDAPEENLNILTRVKQGTYEAIDLKHMMFNADKAGFGEFVFNKKYDGYKKGGILFIHKKMHASVYVFYLGNDSAEFSRLIMDNLFIFKFKE